MGDRVSLSVRNRVQRRRTDQLTIPRHRSRRCHSPEPDPVCEGRNTTRFGPQMYEDVSRSLIYAIRNVGLPETTLRR